MPHHLKMMIIHQVNDIIFRTRKKIIQAYHVMTFVYINPEKPDVPLNKNDAFQKVQKRRVQEKR